MKIKTHARPARDAQHTALAVDEVETGPGASTRSSGEQMWQAPPLPDVSGFRPATAKPGEAACFSPLQVQMGQGTPPDGADFLTAQLQQIRNQTTGGEPVMVVFDLDNTLFDTRARTLQAAKSFDAHHNSQWFSNLNLEDVQLDGEKTARQMREPPLPEEVIQAFSDYWGEAFWTPDNLRHDHEMPETLRWAKAAQEAGADVRYLTGRTADFYDASLAQLRRAGLRVDESQLCCKPSVDVATAPFKAEVLRDWTDKAPIAWFLTEGLRDLSHVQTEMPALPTVWLDCSFEDSATHKISAETPRLPACF